MNVNTIEISGIQSALRALHLPYKKECDSITQFCCNSKENEIYYDSHCMVSEHDLKLLKALIRRGDEHAKVLRGINVTAEISAPLFMWSELDTYNIGVVKYASESTMHTLAKTGVKLDDFDISDKITEFHSGNHGENDALVNLSANQITNTIIFLNELSAMYRQNPSIDILLEMKRNLPTSYIQKRVWSFSYQALRRIYKQRHDHRLPHWHVFCDWIKTLPFANELILFELDEEK